MKVYNTCCKVSNYCTGELEEVLNQYSDYGFNLVSTLIAKNECDIDVMYLFFYKSMRIISNLMKIKFQRQEKPYIVASR